MSLEGFEVAAKITGAGAKNIAILLYSILKEEKKTKGKARLSSMLRSGKEHEGLYREKQTTSKHSRRKPKSTAFFTAYLQTARITTLMQRSMLLPVRRTHRKSAVSWSASNLASVDTASIVTEAEKSKDEKNGQPEPEITTPEKAEKDKLLDELMGKPVGKEGNAPNPSVAKTEKSPQSEPISEKQSKSVEGATMTKDKPSVKEELRKIKESRKEQEADKGTSALGKSGASDRAKSANGKTEHKQPQRKRNTKNPKKRGKQV